MREALEAAARNTPRRVVRLIDYVLVTTDDYGGRTPAGQPEAIEVFDGVRIEVLDDDLARRCFAATAPRGENWDAPLPPRAIHAYVRDVWEEGAEEPPDRPFHWDAERRMWPVVQLSRLVRDNNVSTEYAVRRVIRADGSEMLVPFDGYETHVVYRLYPERQGWLDADEALQLHALVEAFRRCESRLPEGVRRALRRADAITSERYLEDAIPLVVAALESLVKVGRESLTQQFAQRVPALAKDLGVELSVEECEEVYNDRSGLVHGAGVDLSQAHDEEEFGRRFNSLQEVLRRTVRLAIEDLGFAVVFEKDETIRERWPTIVTVRQNGEKVEKII